MYSFLFQDWTTLRLNAEQLSLTQSEADWVNMELFQDMVFWLEVRDAVLGGGDLMLLMYETAPAKDENLFTLMFDAPIVVTSSTPQITKVLRTQPTSCPPAKWVRWRLWNAVTPPTSEWGATFRVHCSANAVGPLR
jgi:hypothetical protein